MASSVIKEKQLIREENKTGTTDIDGLISLGVQISSHTVLTAFSTSANYVCIPMVFSNVWHAKVLSYSAMKPIKNTSVSIKYYYN